MKHLLLIPLLFLCISVWAQPAGYVSGTQVCWTFNGNPHGYFKAAGNGERHILLTFTGAGEFNCTDYQRNAPTKLFNDLGINWDGRTVRAPGDTIVWEVLTLPNYANKWTPAYARSIDSFFAKIAPIDTAEHWRFHIAGLSHGVERFWMFLDNHADHNSPYRHIFSTTISLSGQEQDSTRVANSSRGKRNWVWVGEDDYGQTQPGVSQKLYDDLPGHRRLTIQQSTPAGSASHNGVTWDSCHSLKGVDTTTNTWLWMVAKPTVPNLCVLPGGPSGYVAGTQVNWQFNARSHGYFRAAGCGERHVLVVFTGNESTDSTNYQLHAPTKLFNDFGINWDGRTVRAAGDTVIWEVLTIPNTTNYWLQPYANDIAYFFQNIGQIDTSEHRYFHIAASGIGLERMWGYLSNEQSHNSPYRKIFSTVISASAAWSNIYPQITANSGDKRHWVWVGADETSLYQPAASQAYYDALNGNKRITIQTGGDHSDITWDSCYSRAGADSSNNRWLWMVTPPANNLQLNTATLAQPFAAVVAKLQARPTPVRSTTYLTWKGNTTAYHLTVADLTGRVRISRGGIQGQGYMLDLSLLEHGWYVVKLEGGGERHIVKLLKE